MVIGSLSNQVWSAGMTLLLDYDQCINSSSFHESDGRNLVARTNEIQVAFIEAVSHLIQVTRIYKWIPPVFLQAQTEK
jgi:hypothetical protein